MTTCVGYVTDDFIYLGTDSRCCRGNEIQLDIKKIVENKSLIFCYSGDAIICNILAYLTKIKHKNKKKYIQKNFVPSFMKKIKALKDDGFDIDSYHLLISDHRDLYELDCYGFSQKILKDKIVGIGSGSFYACSFFEGLEDKSNIEKSIKKSIEYACKKDCYSGGKIIIKKYKRMGI